VVAAIVFGLNLLLAFASPTWTVLVYFRITPGVGHRGPSSWWVR